jgi:hypothetical protein
VHPLFKRNAIGNNFGGFKKLKRGMIKTGIIVLIAILISRYLCQKIKNQFDDL